MKTSAYAMELRVCQVSQLDVQAAALQGTVIFLFVDPNDPRRVRGDRGPAVIALVW